MESPEHFMIKEMLKKWGMEPSGREIKKRRIWRWTDYILIAALRESEHICISAIEIVGWGASKNRLTDKEK